MKKGTKGTKGTLIGLVIFFIVASILFKSDNTIFKTIQPLFFIMIVGGLIPMFKKAKKSQTEENNDDKNYENAIPKESYKSSVFNNDFERKAKDKLDTYNNSKKDAYQSQGTSYSKRCKKCNSLISNKDSYCPECGASQNDTIICEYCGHENPATNALCEKCNGFL
jgi:RNA polymerase subunit RPABC4/transcription elongation factor Spt4